MYFLCTLVIIVCLESSVTFGRTNGYTVPFCSGRQLTAPTLGIQSKTVPVKVGDEINITCTACGNKHTFWFKDGKRLGETDRIEWIPARKIQTNPQVVLGKLNIRRLNSTDSGNYTCYTLDFIQNVMQQDDINLHVKHRKTLH